MNKPQPIEKYRLTYEYINPGPAGPFKGSITLSYKVARGVEIYAAFGSAIVKSCRAIKRDAQDGKE